MKAKASSSKPVTVEKTNYTCSICCETYNEATKIKTLSCNHNLCLSCFKIHSNISNDCPFCRKDIYKPNLIKRKAYSKVHTALNACIDATQLIKSLKNAPLDDDEREIIKTLFKQLEENMIDLRLIVDNRMPVLSNTLNFNNNIYLNEHQFEIDGEVEGEGEESEIEQIFRNWGRNSITTENPPVLLNTTSDSRSFRDDILNDFMAIFAAGITNSNGNRNGSSGGNTG